MQEPHLTASNLDDTQNAPLHNDIAQCAKELWVHYGKPADRDLAIWLEAEHKMFSAVHASREKNSGPVPAPARVKPSRH